MTSFDALIIVLIGLSVALAAYRGGLAELATLGALGIGGGAGLTLAQPIAGAIGRGDSTITALVAGGVIAGLFFLGALVGLTMLVSRIRLDERQRMADRIGGGAFGFIRAFALIGLGFLGYAYYLDTDNRPPAVTNALLLPLAKGAAGVIESFAPARDPLNIDDGARTGRIDDGKEPREPDAEAAAGAEDQDAVAAILQDVDS
ncbi:MAG: hypothetical protein GC152_05910 [Alphaproteobacteria bacterium]|nr:hypothetical protein [Alphaproteobacteria bacterium]